MHWMAWFIRIMLLFIVLITIFSIQLKYLGNPSVLSYSDISAVWVFLVIYSMSLTTFCFMISAMFSKATTAVLTYSLISFMLSIGILSLEYELISFKARMALCLINYTAMIFGLKLIVRYEDDGVGLQWGNLFTPVSVDNDFTVGHASVMLLIDTILYLMIALYTEQVYPGNYGVPEEWHFPITVPYNFFFKKINKQIFKPTSNAGTVFEDYPTDKNVGIQINQLRKVFKNTKVAVDNLTLNIF